MSTIVLRCDITWTTTGAGGYTKTTLPATSPGGSQRTLDFADPALQQACEDFRKKVVQWVQALDPNADAHCTISTSTVT